MATTTNYSWSTPDDTALVKDGAAAIRTLGSSADTTVKALNPGTTAGDVDYYTTSTAKARLAIGTAGQVLTVNSGATAPQWATPATPASGLTLITRNSFSNVASVDIDSVFSATYVTYKIVIETVQAATGADDLLMRFRYGSSTFTTGYSGNKQSTIYTSTTQTNTNYNNVGEMVLSDDTADTFVSIEANLTATNPEPSKIGYIQGQSTNFGYKGLQFWYAGGDATNPITGFRLLSSSTNITGTVAVYGLAI